MHEQNLLPLYAGDGESFRNQIEEKKKSLKTHFNSKHRELTKQSVLHQHSGQ